MKACELRVKLCEAPELRSQTPITFSTMVDLPMPTSPSKTTDLGAIATERTKAIATERKQLRIGYWVSNN